MTKMNTLKMILARVGEFDWSPPEYEPPFEPQKPIPMDVEEIQRKVGFSITIQPRQTRAKLQDCMWVDRFSTYFGEFSDGFLGKFRYGGGKFFVLEQHRVIKSETPQIFIYPDHVKAYQKSIKGGIVTVVLPPSNLSMPFAKWVKGDIMVELFFLWEVDEVTVEQVISSFE